ncbi:MAG: chemotaxis-specific protein-glutamate methyltransferase CheB [Kofleriaceae bacterium]
MTVRRVVVVEDSLTIRKRLCEVIAEDPELQLVGEAEDGKQAIELCMALRPDVMSLDMMLPVMTGLAATEYIMAHVPTPILIVSASTNRAELFKTYDALAAGAVDVLEKPRGDELDAGWEARYKATLKLVSKIKVITHPRARLGSLGRSAPLVAPVWPPSVAQPIRAIAIGVSTGGPAAIVEVLRGLRDPGVPILLVLHIDEPFSSAFAEWLDNQTQHRVSYARDGDSLLTLGGRVVMAPPGRHLIVSGGRLLLTTDVPRHSCRPSVDVLFESLARDCGAGVIACLLTGMGRDGASGLLDIRRAGGVTIAQDEASCVVYGMPREAALLGAAERILPLSEIGQAVSKALAASQRRPR